MRGGVCLKDWGSIIPGRYQLIHLKTLTLPLVGMVDGIFLKIGCTWGKFQASTCTPSILVASSPTHTSALHHHLRSLFLLPHPNGRNQSPRRSSQVLWAVRLAWWWVRHLDVKSALNIFSPLNQFISSLSQDADSFMPSQEKELWISSICTFKHYQPFPLVHYIKLIMKEKNRIYLYTHK